jgi:hypothetical protein
MTARTFKIRAVICYWDRAFYMGIVGRTDADAIAAQQVRERRRSGPGWCAAMWSMELTDRLPRPRRNVTKGQFPQNA